MQLTMPLPADLLQWTWFGIGLAFGRGFGKKLDHDIKASDYFKKRHPITQNFISRTLDFLHHWWMGALLMVYGVHPEVYWFGAGLLVDDIPDIPGRLRRLLTGWGAWLIGQD